MSRLTKSRVRLAAALVAATAMAGTANPAFAQMTQVTIGTNATGTLYNQIGTAVAKIVKDEVGVPAAAQPFAGTSVYLPKLQRGDVELGLNSGLDSAIAFTGQDEYKQPLDKLRGAIMLTYAYYGMYAKASSGLTTVAELKDKPVVIGYRAIASFDKVNNAILGTAGMTPKDLDAQVVTGIPEAVRDIVDGRTMAAGTITGFPALREADASVSGGLIILKLGENDKPINDLPGFDVAEIKPGPAFVGVKEPMRVARFSVFLNTSSNLSDDDVYAIVKAVHSNWTQMGEQVPALRSIKADQLVPVNFGHPYHEGAVRYFEEVGLWTPEHAERQAALLGTAKQ